MAYFDGFVVPVPQDKKDAYLAMARKAAPLFHEFGAVRHVEAWEDDVPDGKLTDFRRAVKAEPGEAIVYSWVEYPDRATRDAANARMMSDERMQPDGEMPFDGKRMIYAGFDFAIDFAPTGAGGYIDGALIAVPTARKDEYLAFEREMSPFFIDEGAVRIGVGWGDDVPDGTTTDFKGAVQAKPDETVAFAWIEWPSKEARDAGWGRLMHHGRMNQMQPPFDGTRMIHGGFVPVLDE